MMAKEQVLENRACPGVDLRVLRMQLVGTLLELGCGAGGDQEEGGCKALACCHQVSGKGCEVAALCHPKSDKISKRRGHFHRKVHFSVKGFTRNSVDWRDRVTLPRQQ